MLGAAPAAAPPLPLRRCMRGCAERSDWDAVPAHAAPAPPPPPAQMGHATAEAVVRAGLTLVPFSFTGQSEAVAVGNTGVCGVPVELVSPEERQAALDTIRAQYPGVIVIDYTLPSVVNGERACCAVRAAHPGWPASGHACCRGVLRSLREGGGGALRPGSVLARRAQTDVVPAARRPPSPLRRAQPTLGSTATTGCPSSWAPPAAIGRS